MKVRPAMLVVLAAEALVVVGTASAFGTVRDLFPGTTKGSKMAFTSVRNGTYSTSTS